ncbi:hypothetical protein [Pseudoflavitalea rhizosphaerae]|uniref:hypothetical protein n=1 Tax=Pseudoflavitalea rhizosphaerae TaxID=1884793 RepID=UPI000F8EEA64|nr:hypothetical protein [Pseudoflavitalea rhizosphaerae]
MKVPVNSYVLDNLDEFIDPDFFTKEEQLAIVKRAWSTFLAEKKRRKLPPPSPEDVRERLKMLDDIVFIPVKKALKQKEYDQKYLGALIRLHHAFAKADGEMTSLV